VEAKPSGVENENEQKTNVVEIKSQNTFIENQYLIPMAKRFTGEIVRACNKKFKDGGARCVVTVASVIFRNTLVNVTLQVEKRGSETGKKLISHVYDEAKKDALAHFS
jgi:hypothetical protein